MSLSTGIVSLFAGVIGCASSGPFNLYGNAVRPAKTLQFISFNSVIAAIGGITVDSGRNA